MNESIKSARAIIESLPKTIAKEDVNSQQPFALIVDGAIELKPIFFAKAEAKIIELVQKHEGGAVDPHLAEIASLQQLVNQTNAEKDLHASKMADLVTQMRDQIVGLQQALANAETERDACKANAENAQARYNELAAKLQTPEPSSVQ